MKQMRRCLEYCIRRIRLYVTVFHIIAVLPDFDLDELTTVSQNSIVMQVQAVSDEWRNVVLEGLTHLFHHSSRGQALKGLY